MQLEIKPITYGSREYQEELELRDTVMRKPLGRSLYDETLDEVQDYHLGVYEQNRLIAAMLIHEQQDGTLLVKQVAVLEEYRGQGVGAMMMKKAIAWAAQEGYRTLLLHARDYAIPFYEKLGFIGEGELFLEVGIDHLLMRLTL